MSTPLASVCFLGKKKGHPANNSVVKEGAEDRTDQHALQKEYSGPCKLPEWLFIKYIYIYWSNHPLYCFLQHLQMPIFHQLRRKQWQFYHTWHYAVIVITNSVYFCTGQNLRVAALRQTKVCLSQYPVVTVNSISIPQSFISFGRITSTDPLHILPYLVFPPVSHSYFSFFS